MQNRRYSTKHIAVNKKRQSAVTVKRGYSKMKYAPNYGNGCKELIKRMFLQDTKP